jgi:hypothetical protein
MLTLLEPAYNKTHYPHTLWLDFLICFGYQESQKSNKKVKSHNSFYSSTKPTTPSPLSLTFMCFLGLCLLSKVEYHLL